METFLKILKNYTLIFVVSWITGIILILLDYSAENMNAIAFPIVIALVFLIFRKKLDMTFVSKVNMVFFLALLIRFTILMLYGDGNINYCNIEVLLFLGFSVLLLPFIALLKVVHDFMLFYVCALISYFVAYIVSACVAKISIKKMITPCVIAAICIAVCIGLYLNCTPPVDRTWGTYPTGGY